MLKKYKPYIISVVIALLVGALSALVTKGSMDIYATLRQPPLSPPSWLFPVVWTVLFVLMGIGAGGVYEKGKENPDTIKRPLTIYAVNLGVNFLWSIIFFNLRAFLFSLVWLIFLVAIIVYMIAEFKKVCMWCGNLQIPYLIWCLFALYLNIGIYILN